MDLASARVITAYTVIAVVALLVSVVVDGPLGALGFVVGVLVGAVAFMALVWSRVDLDAVKRVLGRD